MKVSIGTNIQDGPWGGGNNQNPWGKRPNSNGTPPDVDQMLKESKDKCNWSCWFSRKNARW